MSHMSYTKAAQTPHLIPPRLFRLRLLLKPRKPLRPLQRSLCLPWSRCWHDAVMLPFFAGVRAVVSYSVVMLPFAPNARHLRMRVKPPNRTWIVMWTMCGACGKYAWAWWQRL